MSESAPELPEQPTEPRVTDEWWTAADCATWLGISPALWRNYTSRGMPAGNPAPRPARKFGRDNVWRPRDVVAWNANRPGRGQWGSSRTTVRKSVRQR